MTADWLLAARRGWLLAVRGARLAAAEAGESGQLSTLKCQASENIAFESRSIFLALEKIALEKESFVTSFGYMSIVIESGERGDS